MKYPFISIVVPVRNEEKNLPRLLVSLGNLDYPKDRVEVIIVDGCSTDQTTTLAKKFGAKVFYNRRKIRGAGCQVGVKKAKGSLIAFTDADCVVPKNWLKGLLEFLAEPKIASVGGPNITPKDDTAFAQAAGEVVWLLTRAGARYGLSGKKTTETYHNPGCNVLYRKTAIEKVGGFNPQLLTCEDEELDFRLRQTGYKLLFTPKISVDHYRRPTYKKIFIQAYRFAVGRAQAIKLHPKMARWFHFIPSLALLLVIGPIPAFLVLLGVSFYLSLTKKYASPCVYFLILLCWFFGWSLGFIRGLLSPKKLTNTWANYWKNYRGVTKLGAWSQKQALKIAFFIIDDTRIKKSIKIIDVGCGEGRTLQALRKAGFRNSLGIDNSQESLAICRRNGLKINQDVFLKEAVDTGYKNREFDLVFSEGLLEHFQNPLSFIEEMTRISQKYVLIIQPNHYSPYGLAITVLGHWLRNNIREYSFPKKYFVEQFANFGFGLKAEKQTPLAEFFVLLFEGKKRRESILY